MKSVREIYYLFNGKLVGGKFLKQAVCQTLSKMPDEVINFVTKNCWFVGSMDDAYAFAFTGNDLKNMHLIFLSEDLLSQSKQQVEYSIAHEIGHVMLKHKNSTLVSQTKEEIRQQEREADLFAKNLGF